MQSECSWGREFQWKHHSWPALLGCCWWEICGHAIWIRFAHQSTLLGCLHHWQQSCVGTVLEVTLATATVIVTRRVAVATTTANSTIPKEKYDNPELYKTKQKRTSMILARKFASFSWSFFCLLIYCTPFLSPTFSSHVLCFFAA